MNNRISVMVIVFHGRSWWTITAVIIERLNHSLR